MIPEGLPLRLREACGRGLPAVYDAIVTRDLDAYVDIGNQFRELFPSVKGISLRNTDDKTKALGIPSGPAS